MAFVKTGAGKITAQITQTTDKGGKKVTSSREIKPPVKKGK